MTTWGSAYYDATRAHGSKLYIQAEFAGTSDVDWVAAGREFARGPAFRPILNTHKGEFKSALYFKVLESEEIRSYPSLYERLRNGPRLAHLFVYAMDEFSRIGRESLGIRESDERRLPREVKRALHEQVAIATLKTSPVAGFQERLSRAGVPNYRPTLHQDYFDPALISKRFDHRFGSVVQVAARWEAVFGDLKRLDDDAHYTVATVVEPIHRLVRTDRYFDKDSEGALN